MKIPPLPYKRPICGRTTLGFSLVEVMIALGVFSFAIMGVLGVLPTAVTTIREASEKQIVSDILTQVAADMRSTVDASEAAHRSSEFPQYFDHRGVLLGTGANMPADAAYRVDFAGVGSVSHDGTSLNTSLQQASFILAPLHGSVAPIVIGVGFATF